jgi:ABC-type uncharacterized transport system permease subunit
MQNNPNDLNVVEAFLVRYGIDIGFLVSGFFGALLLVSKNSAQKLSTTIASILAGTACANYLTPVVMSVLPVSVQTNGKYAVAFVMGFMGLKGLELILEKWFNKKIEHVEEVMIKTKSTRKQQKTKKG